MDTDPSTPCREYTVSRRGCALDLPDLLDSSFQLATNHGPISLCRVCPRVLVADLRSKDDPRLSAPTASPGPGRRKDTVPGWRDKNIVQS